MRIQRNLDQGQNAIPCL